MAGGSGQETEEYTGGMAVTLKDSACSSVHKMSEEFGPGITTPLTKRIAEISFVLIILL